MENASDALIMAGSVLILILILSIVVLAFSNARESLDTIFAFSDRETLTMQDDDYYYLSTSGQNSNITRTVGTETIIPSFYRAFYENYKIEFDFGDTSDYYLYKDTDDKKIKSWDLSELGVANYSQYEVVVEAILYHSYKGEKGTNAMQKFNEDFEKIKIDTTTEGLIDFIKDKTFIEELGTYYIEDVNSKESNIEEYGEEYRFIDFFYK